MVEPADVNEFSRESDQHLLNQIEFYGEPQNIMKAFNCQQKADARKAIELRKKEEKEKKQLSFRLISEILKTRKELG